MSFHEKRDERSCSPHPLERRTSRHVAAEVSISQVCSHESRGSATQRGGRTRHQRDEGQEFSGSLFPSDLSGRAAAARCVRRLARPDGFTADVRRFEEAVLVDERFSVRFPPRGARPIDGGDSGSIVQHVSCMAWSTTALKRQKEQARRDRQQRKATRRLQRREDSVRRLSAVRPGEDPDIAGIVPGPQPPLF